MKVVYDDEDEDISEKLDTTQEVAKLPVPLIKKIIDLEEEKVSNELIE